MRRWNHDRRFDGIPKIKLQAFEPSSPESLQSQTSLRSKNRLPLNDLGGSSRSTAYFALSPVTTLFDTVACASSHRLDANDWGVRTTRLRRTLQHHSSSALPASTASRPAFVTIAIRPSCRNETVRISELIWVKGKQKYFCKRGLTRFLKIRSDLPVGLICHSRMQKFDLPWRQISKQQDVPATAVSIIVAIRLPCRRCSPNGFTRSPERHTEGR